MSSRQDEEAAESCFGNLGSCFRSLRAILFFTTLAGIIPWWPHNRVHPANEPDEATLDDVVEAGGSEKTEEEALAGANEEEVGPGTEKVQEEAACIDEAEEEAGPSLENDEESPASDLVEQEDQLAPKVDGMDDESLCFMESLSDSNHDESDTDSVVESLSSRQDEEAAATLDDVVEAGGSEKTEEEALAGANEEEVGPGTEKVQEEAACIDEAEEEAGPSLENDEESPASDLVEQEDQLAPKVDGMDDESLCFMESLSDSNHDESDTDSVVESLSSRQDEEAADSSGTP
ncbi:major centromere autoantigen B-like isoform X1 [Sus scrofa]|uniref:major centromere autoantigen B-like isoform X1 n=1 Tax=Sus scrofa TaxID=9823 RepID=UPI000A2B19A8|nr:major centromere autoantigen B-like isoform X1 [Sus scrofa]